jgi:BirA family biotin operon repressor/biotin-[acetyl-CoA-carboxylase] ligase
METIYIQKMDSTQTHIKHLLKDSKSLKPLALYTFNQENGYGQGNNLWDCPPEQGLALSIAWPISKDASKDWILTNKFISKTITDFLRKNTQLPVLLKWPNDLIVYDKKLGGMIMQTHALSETTYFIVGLGLNFNLNDTPLRTSLKELDVLILDKHHFTQSLIYHLEEHWNGPWPLTINQDYHQLLWKNQEFVNVQVEISQENEQKTELMNGIFLGVDEAGRALFQLKDTWVSLHHGQARIPLSQNSTNTVN